MIQLKATLNNHNVKHTYFKQYFLCFCWTFWKKPWNKVGGMEVGNRMPVNNNRPTLFTKII